MNISDSLYTGARVYFAPIDHEKDAVVESRWTQDETYQRGFPDGPARPLSPGLVRKRYETLEKWVDENKNMFHFAVHTCFDGRLVGFAQLFWIEWTHGNGNIRLGIGSPADRGQGLGTETLQLLMRYAFNELNLFRLSAAVPADNAAALHLFARAGFVEEVRRRQALYRDGQRWDLLQLGLLREEWEG